MLLQSCFLSSFERLCSPGVFLNNWKDKCCNHCQKNQGKSVGGQGSQLHCSPWEESPYRHHSKHIKGKKSSGSAVVYLRGANCFSTDQITFLFEIASSLSKERAKDCCFAITLLRLSTQSSIVSLWANWQDVTWTGGLQLVVKLTGPLGSKGW